MTHEQFAAWREAMNLNKRQAGAVLGLSPETIANYEFGKRRDGQSVSIPRHVDLACMAIAMQFKGWSEYPR